MPTPGTHPTFDEGEPRSPEEAARWAADPSRLMQGEDPNTPRLSDAIHWMQVYEELITLKDDLLGTARERMQALPEPAAEEIRGSDLVLLGAERDRFVSRLNFWKRRHMELEDLA